ncbi:MAG: hypothetical protein V1859_03275 [archaeon]
MTQSKNMPEKKFRAGAIVATVWKNSTVSKDKKKPEPVEYRTVSFERRYTDKSGAWQSTNSFRANDLPKATLILNKAFEYLVLKESENTTIPEEDIL